MRFPQVKGKTLQEVDFASRAEDHSITLVFEDKTIRRSNRAAIEYRARVYHVRRL